MATFGNPFASLLDDPANDPIADPAGSRFVERGSMRHFFGAGQTRDEALFDREEQRHRAGLAQEAQIRRTMAGVLQIVNNKRLADPNKPPHAIMSEVLQDPAFIDAAMKVPADAMQQFVNELVKATSPPEPKMENVAPGHALVSIDKHSGKATQQFANPPASVQENQFLLGLDAKDRAILMETSRADKDPSEKLQALRTLVAQGKMTPDQANKVLAGVLSVVGQRDEFGNVVATGVFDKTDNTFTPLPPPADVAQPGEPTVPGQRTAPVSPHEKPGARLNEFQDDEAGIFDYVGLAGTATEAIGGITGQVNPQSIDPKATAAKNAFNKIRVGVQRLKEGRLFASEAKALQELAPDSGIFSSPPQALESTINLYQWGQTQLNANRRVLIDRKQPKRAREEAQERINALNLFMEDLPDINHMVRKREQYRRGEGGLPGSTLRQNLPTPDAVSRRATQAIGDGEAPAAPSVRTEGGPRASFSGLSDAELVQRGIDPRLSLDEVLAIRAEIARRRDGVGSPKDKRKAGQ